MGVTQILNSRDPIVELEKLQLQIFPSKTRVEPNDKFTKTIFGIEQRDYVKRITQKLPCGIYEKKNHKKGRNEFGPIGTPYRIYNRENCHNTEALNMFDLSVLCVCISEWVAGNRYTTLAIIYRGLTGKVNKGTDAKPTPQLREAIMNSLLKLMGTIVTPDMTDLCEYLKYNDGTPIKFHSAILPASIIEAVVGGKDVTTIFFDRESPLWTIANIKNQVIRYDASLLDIADQHNTTLNIGLKTYSMRRVMEIKNHKMTPTLTLDDVFTKCRITNASRKVKMDARNTMADLFENLKQRHEIDSFDFTKKANKIYSLTFTYTRPQPKSKQQQAQATTNQPPESTSSSATTANETPKSSEAVVKPVATKTIKTSSEGKQYSVPEKNVPNREGGTSVTLGRHFGNVRAALR